MSTLEKILSTTESMFKEIKVLKEKVEHIEKINKPLSQPYEHYTTRDKNYKYYNETSEKKFPHLFHTENPQLNNISDLLIRILKSKTQEDKENKILEELKRAKDTIIEIIKESREHENFNIDLKTIISQLEVIIKNQQERRAIVIHGQTPTPSVPKNIILPF